MTHALLAKKLNAVTLEAPTIKDKFERHVKITWFSYIVENAKMNKAKIMPAPAMMLIIQFLDDSHELFSRLQLLCYHLLRETQTRGWVDDINGKYVASLLQTAFAQNQQPCFFNKLKVSIQHRLWAKKDFTAKLLRVPVKQRKSFDDAKSYGEFIQKQKKIKTIMYADNPGMVYVPQFDVYVPKDFHLLGEPLQRYKNQLQRSGGTETFDALYIRRQFLYQGGVLLKEK
jgi:hypothetical protein